jgi:hypothetical protein
LRIPHNNFGLKNSIFVGSKHSGPELEEWKNLLFEATSRDTGAGETWWFQKRYYWRRVMVLVVLSAWLGLGRIPIWASCKNQTNI